MEYPSKTFLMDADRVSSGSGGLDELIFCVMTRRQSSMALGWIRQLEWATTWVQGNPLKHEVQQLHLALMGESLSEITDRLDLILEAIQSSSSGDCCVYPPQSTVILLPDMPNSPLTLPVPDEVIDSGWATGESDYAGYQNYLCVTSDLIIDNMIWKVDQLQEILAGGLLVLGAITTVLGSLTTGGALLAVVVLIGEALAIYDILQGGVDEFVFDEMRAEIESMRDDIRCWVGSGLSIEAVCFNINERAASVGGIAGGLIPFLGWKPVLSGVYSGVDANGQDIVANVGSPVACDSGCSQTVDVVITGNILSGSELGVAVGDVIEVQSIPQGAGAGTTQDVRMSITGVFGWSITANCRVSSGNVYQTGTVLTNYTPVGQPPIFLPTTDFVGDGLNLEFEGIQIRSNRFPDDEEVYIFEFTIINITPA